jgi:hypothetical protein
MAFAVMGMPAAAVETDSTAPVPQSTPKAGASPLRFSAVFDVQVQKNLYDEYGAGSSTRFPSSNNIFHGYQQTFDDFWLRVTLKGSYQLKNLEGVFNLRFYPYWTLRRKFLDESNLYNGTKPDLALYADVFELNQAYIKVFKEYSLKEDLTFRPSFKIGRDGVLNSCSQLFGNYLDQPTGGYGADRKVNIIGPFLNKKVFANQIEAGFTFNAFNMIGGRTSLMIGGNVNNNQFYSGPLPQIYQIEDSKLSAGFWRVYQDLYFMNDRFHIGGGLRDYSTTVDTGGYVLSKSHYFSAQGAFDVVIMKDMKFYTEIAMQKLGVLSSTGIVRPINMGITIPTFGVVDTLAVEWENVGPTPIFHNPIYSLLYNKPFFNPHSMRDEVGGRTPTLALGWGIVMQKKYLDKISIAWGLFTGNAYGDMQAVLRLSTGF